MENTNDFSSVAENYDSSREMPGELLTRIFEHLISLAALKTGDHCLDIGCGTGQMSAYLVSHKFQVALSDVSSEMIAKCRAKYADMPWVTFDISDVRKTKFANDQFNFIISSKLFQHVGEWRTAVEEIKRIQKPQGYFVYIVQKEYFNNSVRKYFKELLTSMGHKPSYPGEIKFEKVHDYFKKLGYKQVSFGLPRLSWKRNFLYSESYENLKNRFHAEFWSVPDEAYNKALQETEKMIKKTKNGFNSVDEKNPYLEVFVLQKGK